MGLPSFRVSANTHMLFTGIKRDIKRGVTGGAPMESKFARLIGATIDDIEKHNGFPIPMLRELNSVSVTMAVPTIAIRRSIGKLFVNAEFFGAWVDNVDDFAFLLMHERGHPALAYLIGTHGCGNFSQDAVINPPLTFRFPRSRLAERLYISRALQGSPWMLVLQKNVDAASALLWSRPEAQVGPWEAIRDWHHMVHDYGPTGYKYIAYQGYGERKVMLLIEQWLSLLPQQPGSPGSSGSYRSSAPTSGYGSGDASDAQRISRPLGHEPDNTEQEDEDNVQEKAEREYKSARPNHYTEAGSPRGHGKSISFAALQAPPELGLSPHDVFCGVPVISLAPPSRDNGGIGLTNAVAHASDGMGENENLLGHIPSMLHDEDAIDVARGDYPEAWLHNSPPRAAYGDLYIDFSISMEEYWGHAINIARHLSGRIRHCIGFASRSERFSIRDTPGLDIGGGTNLNTVLESMAQLRNPLVVWVTDLEFSPSIEVSRPNLEAVHRLNWLLTHVVERLIVCVPMADPQGAPEAYASSIKATYFGGLSPLAQTRVRIVPVTPAGAAAAV